jgi:hypothetical protein
MGDTWIIDMTMYLEANGRIAPLPGPVQRLADHFGAIVAAISPEAPEFVVSTSVPCRRRPRRQRCPGTIQGLIARDDLRIHWSCAVCHDNGAISGWEGSPWDARREGPLH